MAETGKRPEILVGRARTWAAMGQHARATAEAQFHMESQQPTAKVFFLAACVYGKSAEAVRDAVELPEAERKRLSEEYATRAVSCLARAEQGDFFAAKNTVKFLKSEPDFAGLRSRTDFQKLAGQVKGE